MHSISPMTLDTPVFNYHLLRHALDAFKKNLSELDAPEYDKVYHKARKSYELESLVISAPEAVDLIVSQDQVDASVNEIAARYDSQKSFLQDLAVNGLDEEALRLALHRELLFNHVMQRVSAKSADVSDLDVRLFYEMHSDRFASPEIRVARHILITINPEFPENKRGTAHKRILDVEEALAGRTNRFHEFAKRYSECPTAMDGGKLGDVKRGQLFPELDSVLFDMQPEQISPVTESEMGFHLLLCEKIKPGKRVPLTRAAPQIVEILENRQRRNCQKAWIVSLREAADEN